MAWIRPLLYTLLLSLAVVSLAGCSSDEPTRVRPALPGGPLEPGDELEYELFPTTKLLTDATAAQATAPDTDGVMRLPASAKELAGLAFGDVLLGYQTDRFPRGLLRMVTEVSEDGDTLVVHTVPSLVETAFRKLHFKARRKLADLAGGGTVWKRPDLTPKDSGGAHGSEIIDFFLFNGDHDPKTTDDQVHVHGELGGGYEYLIGVDLDWGEVFDIPSKVVDCVVDLVTGGGCDVKSMLPELKAGLEVSADATAKLRVEGAAFEGFEDSYTLADIVPNPPLLVIGPLVFVIDLRVVAALSGQASSQFSLYTGASFEAGAALLFSSKTGSTFVPPHESHSFDPPEVELGLHAKARAEAGPELALLLYDLVGPSAKVTVFAQVEADRAKSPCFTATAGLELELALKLGVELPIVGYLDLASTSKSWQLFSKELASGGCQAPPGTNTLPPGAGADAETLLAPTYTPWSRTYSDVVSGGLYSLGLLVGSQVTRAIDGRFFAAGSAFGALTKLEQDGDVLWSRRVVDLAYPAETGPERRSLIVRKVAPALDGTVVGITAPDGIGGGPRYGLVKLGQSGGGVWGERFEIPCGRNGTPNGTPEEGRAFHDLVADGAGGFFVVGTYNPPSSTLDDLPVDALVLHVDGDGKVLWSKRFASPSGRNVMPVAVELIGDTLMVAGLDVDPVDLDRRAFVLRLDTSGALSSASRLECAEFAAQPMQPTTSLVSHGGNLVVAGLAGSYYRSFVITVKPDGTPGAGSMPWSGSNLDYLRIDALAELPTTGYVAAASFVYGYENTQLALMGLDAIGRFQWFERYKPAGPSVASGFGSLLPTDEGGLMTISQITRGSDPTELWALEPFAKDGAIAFASGTVTVDEPPMADAACTPVLSPLALTAADLDLQPAPMQLALESVTPSVSSQAP